MRPTSDRHRPRARRRFGQHFLEPVWARKVLAAIAPASEDAFLEIGPGPGALTRPLAAACRSLLACEIDRDLAGALRDENIAGVRVLEGDFLSVPADVLRTEFEANAPPDPRAAVTDTSSRGFRVAGNLPYNVASPILFRLVELSRAGLPLVDATVMLQREVAERLLASPGTRDYGLLTVLIGHRASIDRLLNLPAGAFRPAPKVQSTVVRLRFHDPDPPVADERLLAAVAQAVFSRRRKTLGNALLAYGAITPDIAAHAIADAGIDPVRRPETLSIAEFGRLADAIFAASAAPDRRPSPPVL